MNWNLENLFVSGKYMGEFPITGKVILSRVSYGGGIKHHVELTTPVKVYGSIRDNVILEHSEIQQVMSSICI